MQSILFITVFLPSLISASCGTFEPLGGTFITNSSTTVYNITISEPFVCPPGNHSCWFGSTQPPPPQSNYTYTDALIGGIVTVNRTIGVTPDGDGSDIGVYNLGNYIASSSSRLDNIFSLISSITGTTFVQQATTNLTDEASYGLYAGQAGYVVFEPNLQCVRGTLRDCSGDGYPQVDTAVEACSPVLTQGSCSGPYGCGPQGTIAFMEILANQTSQVPECWPCEEEKRLTGAAGVTKPGGVMMVAGLAMGGLALIGW